MATESEDRTPETFGELVRSSKALVRLCLACGTRSVVDPRTYPDNQQFHHVRFKCPRCRTDQFVYPQGYIAEPVRWMEPPQCERGFVT